MRTRYTSFVLAVLAGVMLVSGSTAAQQSPKEAEQLVGTWTLDSVSLEQDGKKTDLFGPNPKGLTIVDRDGHFARVVTRSDLPQFASNNRHAGTPEENKAAVQGSIAYFGTYTYNAADKSYTFHVEASTFPNWVGATQARIMIFAGDVLWETNPIASTGTGKALIVWKRAH